MKIAITGHRPNKLNNDYDLVSPLIQKIRAEIYHILWENNATLLITGMALGIDTLFAKMAIENNTPFIAAIPCSGQERMWSKKSQELYRDILNNKLCTQKYITTTFYRPHCMQKRNEWMVDNCNILIAVWDETSGGTANCIKYAQSKGMEIGKDIIHINPKLL